MAHKFRNSQCVPSVSLGLGSVDDVTCPPLYKSNTKTSGKETDAPFIKELNNSYEMNVMLDVLCV